jgi:hypothetical protein
MYRDREEKISQVSPDQKGGEAALVVWIIPAICLRGVSGHRLKEILGLPDQSYGFW